LIKRLNLIERQITTIDPLGRKIKAHYFHSDDTAFIELASASGLVLLKPFERNPLITSTRGTGLMMKDAIEQGFERIYLFIGGSATNDAGMGIAHSLGLTVKNNEVFDYKKLQIIVLCDVTNPMHGPNGAAHVYAAQKGAEKWAIEKLDNGLKNYDKILQNHIHQELGSIPGMGAAGAVGASLVALLNARLENGFKMIADLTDFEKEVKNADLIITGEGKIDHTSFHGKVVGNVLDLAQQHSVKTGIVAGNIEAEIDHSSNVLFQKSVMSYAQNLEDAMENTKDYLKLIGKEIGQTEI
jgi:glycerate kinase